MNILEEVADKVEMKWRERYYIDNNDCVNIKKPILTKEESVENVRKNNKRYYETHKTTIDERHRNYRENNKEHMRELISNWARARVICEHCGLELNRKSLGRHIRRIH